MPDFLKQWIQTLNLEQTKALFTWLDGDPDAEDDLIDAISNRGNELEGKK